MRFKALPVTSLEDATVDFEQLQAQLPSLVTALPVQAADGQTIDVVADATNGVTWRFRYRTGSGSLLRWEFIGGPPLFAEIVTSESTSSTTYTDLATVGPSLTVPVGGDFLVTIDAGMFQTTGGNGMMSYQIGATTASDNDAISETSTTSGIFGTATRRKTGIAAGTVFTAKYRSTVNTLTAFRRTLRILPVRIG